MYTTGPYGSPISNSRMTGWGHAYPVAPFVFHTYVHRWSPGVADYRVQWGGTKSTLPAISYHCSMAVLWHMGKAVSVWEEGVRGGKMPWLLIRGSEANGVVTRGWVRWKERVKRKLIPRNRQSKGRLLLGPLRLAPRGGRGRGVHEGD